MSGVYSIDLGLAQQVEKLLAATDADVDQYRSQLFSLVGQLESSWVSPNKQSFENDWVTYCNAVNVIYDVGPRMVNGLKSEINLIEQAEQVQF
jgi:hypothetical protein